MPARRSSRIIGARVLVDGAGHWVPQERPTEVNDALLTFLGGLDLGP